MYYYGYIIIIVPQFLHDLFYRLKFIIINFLLRISGNYNRANE